MTAITIAELQVADPPAAWTAAGFDVGPGGICHVGRVGIRLLGDADGTGRGTGIVGWSLHGLPPDGVTRDVDGVPTVASTEVSGRPGAHPNGVVAIDHVVLASNDLGRTVEALAAIGAAPRRERDAELGGRPIRQVFYRFGEVIVEVVGSPATTSEGPATLWGVTYTVADIDATAAYFGAATAAVKAAVQPGRRITTLRHRDFGMWVRTALISPPE